MMSKIAIITDVNAGLDYIGYDPQIPTLRSVINFGDEHYVDGTEIKADEFYKRIVEEKVIPSTSAPTIGDAMTILDELVEKQYTDVILYSISYQMSSIGQMVETLRPEYEDKINIHVVDTKLAAIPQGYIALQAKKMVEEGKSVEEILDYSKYLIDNSKVLFVVDNLMYLVKNGRLSGASGFAGTLLKIKPILTITKEGKIVSFEKVKTHRKAVERAIQIFDEFIGDSKKGKIYIVHTVREDDAKELAKYIDSKHPGFETEIQMITPAVGAHIGYGVLGIAGFVLDKYNK